MLILGFLAHMLAKKPSVSRRQPSVTIVTRCTHEVTFENTLLATSQPRDLNTIPRLKVSSSIAVSEIEARLMDQC